MFKIQITQGDALNILQQPFDRTPIVNASNGDIYLVARQDGPYVEACGMLQSANPQATTKLLNEADRRMTFLHPENLLPMRTNMVSTLVWRDLSTNDIEVVNAFAQDTIELAKYGQVKAAIDANPDDALIYVERFRTGKRFAISYRIANNLYFANVAKGNLHTHIKDPHNSRFGTFDMAQMYIEKNQEFFDRCKAAIAGVEAFHSRSWTQKQYDLLRLFYERFSAAGAQKCFIALGITHRTKTSLPNQASKQNIKYKGKAAQITKKQITEILNGALTQHSQTPKQGALELPGDKVVGKTYIDDNPPKKGSTFRDKIQNAMQKQNAKGGLLSKLSQEVKTESIPTPGDEGDAKYLASDQNVPTFFARTGLEDIKKMIEVAEFLVRMKMSPTKELREYFLPHGIDLSVMRHEDWLKAIGKLDKPTRLAVEGYKTQSGTRYVIDLKNLPENTEKIVVFI